MAQGLTNQTGIHDIGRYTAYSWNTYPFFWMAILAAAIIILYRYGQKHFLETVRETM